MSHNEKTVCNSALDNSAILRASDICLRISSKTILQNVSLQLNPTWKLALAGISGCGKSSLLKVIAGLIRPDSGQLLFRNKAIWPKQNDELTKSSYRKQVCMVPQDGGLFPNLTIEQNFKLLVDENQGNDQPIFGDVLDSLGLSADLLARYPGEISGGQRQRVAIGRALLRKPRLLMLDEPTSNLDPVAKKQVQKAIRALDSVEVLIIVSHDIDFLIEECTHAAFMHTGEIIAFDSPSKVFRDNNDARIRSYSVE